MTRMKLVLRHACALALMLGFAASAQTIPGSTPPAGETSTTTHVVRYKGTVAAPQGVVNLTFSVYAAQTGGTAVWSETQNVTIDNTGNFSALIGAGTTGGLPEAIFLNESAMWLGVAVTGQAENPRVLLVSVPYAMSAVEAQRLGGHSASEFVLQSQLPAGGTTSGGTGTTTTGGTAPTVSGTVGYISKFNAADSVDDSVIYQDGTGRIGIFTTDFSAIPADNTKLLIAGPMGVVVDNALSTDTTTSVAAFINSVTPNVDQPTSSQQTFLSSTKIFGTHAVNEVVGGLFEADQFGSGNVNRLKGGNAIAYMGGPGNANQVIAFNNEAYAGAGNTQFLIGVRTSANTSKDTGASTTTVNQIGVLVDSNTKDTNSTVNNSYGLMIANQDGVGTNNWAIKTGTGLVDLGDKTQFAVATANRASLNIPLGTAPTAPQEGDVWNEGGLIKFVAGGTTKTFATTADLASVPTSSDLAALQTAINNEAAARAAADSTLTTALNNETSARQAADTTLQSNINAANAAVTTEATARAAADTTLQNNINTVSSNLTAETTARTAADTTLQNNIDAANAAVTAETSARTAADTTLQNNINSVSTNLTAETTARTAADTTLQSNIDAANAAVTSEATTRAAADTALANNIAAESTARASADTALGNSITSLQNSLSTLDSGSAKLAGNNAFTGTNDFSGAAATSPVQVVSTLPTSCVGGKQMAILSTDPAGKQLYICNADNATWSLVGDGAPGAATSSDLSALQTALTNETNARSSADTTLQNNINTVSSNLTAETTARQSADATLQSNIDAANAAITAETSARTAADTTLQTNITNEATARTSADTTLQSNIDAANAAITAETSARTAADTTLQNNINSVSTNLTAETTARTAADTTLQSNIDAANAAVTSEATTRAAADTALQNNINTASAAVTAEAATRASADTALSNSITSLQNSLSTLDSGSAKLAGNNAFTGSNDFSGATATSPVQVVSTLPASCVGGKQMAILSTDPAGKQLYICNADNATWSLVGDGAPGAATSSDLSALQTALTNETSARTAADTTLQSNINTVASNLTAETTARQSADTTLQSNIDAVASNLTAETTARQAADTTLQTNITNEASARTAADTTLQSNIDAANTAVTNETAARTAADTTLQNNINSEATTRSTADTTLQSNIAAEAATRASADTALSNSITSLQNSLSTLDSGSAKLAGNNTFTGANDFSGASSTAPVKVVTIATTPSTCVANKDLIVKSDAPAGQQLFLCNSSGNGYNLLGGTGSGTVTNIATGSGLTGGPITSTGTISIATGGVTNAMLANSGVTVTAGTGLSGGGAVSLGGTITLNNTGALSFNGRTGAITPAANDYSFAQISGTALASQGGTGVTSSGAAGNFLRSNGTGWASSAIQASDLPSLSSTYVDLSSAQTIAGTKTFSSTISGNISGTASNVTGTVAVANGGTNATTAAGARTSLGAAASGANSDITSLSGLTTALSAVQGGTSVTSSGAAGNVLRSNGTTWTSSAIQASDLPSLSTTYVDLSSAQTIGGAKTFSSGITGTISNSLALNGKADTAFEQVVNKNAASGYAGLDASSRIAKAQAPSTTVYTDASNTFSTGTQDFSAATKTLPVKSVTIATTPASCTASKELIIKTDAPAGQQLFICNAAGNGYVLVGDGSGTVTSITTGSGLTGGPITSSGTISIATGGVTNAMLANSSVTVTAGTGMTGGGSVALGGSVTVNNNGVLSFNGRNGAVTPAANDYSFSQISGTAAATQGGTGITSSGATGNVLRSNGTTWASSAIQASDLPSLSSTYVDLSSAQTIAGTKTFSSTISGNISGTASNVTGTVATTNGGTGLTSPGASGNILVSNGTTWTSSAPTILSGNYVDLTTNQSIAGTKTFTGVVDHSVATQTLPVRAVTVATMGTSCTANKEMIVVTDGQPGRQLWLCNSTGNGWNLLGDGIGGNGVTFNAVNVPANSLLLTKNTCSATYTGTYPTVVAGQDIPIPPATGTLTQQSTLVVSPISSMTNSMPAGWTSYQYYAYVDASNQAFLHVCNPTQNNISTLSGGSGAITFNVRAIN